MLTAGWWPGLADIDPFGITEEFIQQLEEIDFSGLSMEELQQLRMHGISTKYIEGIKESGLEDIDVDELIELKIHGVTPKYIQALGEEGIEQFHCRGDRQTAHVQHAPQISSARCASWLHQPDLR